MRIKWKGGLVLLFLLTSFLVYRFLGEYNSWGMSLSENISLHVYLWLFALTEVVIFLIGIYYSTKKIENKTFLYKRLFIFNFLFWIIIVVFFEILGLFIFPSILKIFGIPFSGEGAGFFLLYWAVYTPPIAFFSILIFSLIPSIIFNRIYNQSRYQKRICYFTLSIGVLILLLGITMVLTCDFGHSMKCIGKKAVNDIGICEKEKTDFDKCRCYSNVVEGEGYSKDIEPCNRYKNLEAFCSDEVNRCISYVAKNSKNSAICEFIESRSNDWSKENCLEYSKK